MRRLALLAVLQATCALTAAPALRRSRKLALLSTPADDDEAPPEINEDFRDFRARLIARTKGEGLTEAGDEKAVAEFSAGAEDAVAAVAEDEAPPLPVVLGAAAVVGIGTLAYMAGIDLSSFSI